MNCGFSPFDLHTSGEPNVLDAHGTSVKLGIYTPVRGPSEESASKAVLAWDTLSWCFCRALPSCLSRPRFLVYKGGLRYLASGPCCGNGCFCNRRVGVSSCCIRDAVHKIDCLLGMDFGSSAGNSFCMYANSTNDEGDTAQGWWEFENLNSTCNHSTEP